MVSDVPTGQVSDLDWLLIGRVQRVPFTCHAFLLFADGLVKSAHGLDADSADPMAGPRLRPVLTRPQRGCTLRRR